MGSGVLLAILVGLWFVVLVPMVVTRGDLAVTPAEPMRVLRRRSDGSAKSMKDSADQTTSSRAVPGPHAQEMPTEPIPVLPRRVPGAALAAESSPVDGRPVQAAKPVMPVEPVKGASAATAEPKAADSPIRDLITRREVDIRARRRRMLLGLIALAVLWAGFAAFWQPVLWWPQILLDLVVFSYLVFLRLEAQREQDRLERRRARAATRVSLPEDRTERSVRKHVQYQQHITAATGHGSIGIDDDDPSFAEMPTFVPTPRSRVAAEAPAWHERKAV